MLLVDDHEVIRVGLRTVLGQNQGVSIVGEAGTMGDAIQQSQKLKPDIILMDVRLPDGSGVDACREILGMLPGTRVIFSRRTPTMTPFWQQFLPVRRATC